MRKINIGVQGFESIRSHGTFYIDKSLFIKEWWENLDTVTLITRPRRFGKTLNLDMLNCFFSNRFSERSDLFDGLNIWKDEKYRKIQGTWPVIFLSFADVKEKTYESAVRSIKMILWRVWRQYGFLKDAQELSADERQFFASVSPDMDDETAKFSISLLCEYLSRVYGKKVLVFMDEYDTPLQEAYINDYWEEMTGFIRSFFNSSFKTNQNLYRALLTGITRISKESIFSDLNNPSVVTTTSQEYAAAFGFTEEEVSDALKEFGLSEQKEQVKQWYDGFTFGSRTDIYNPWSITNYLKTGEFSAYWADTSSNELISSLIRKGDDSIKQTMESLLKGDSFKTTIDEEFVFSDLDYGAPEPVWSLMLASGYLRFLAKDPGKGVFDAPVYTLALTNGEVRRMFVKMIRRWFEPAGRSNNLFIKAMISGDTDSMNHYMTDIALTTISSFDTGNKPSATKPPEKFYHGFVLGLLVQEQSRYEVRSNQESGWGRYDICMFPKKDELPGIVMEFKVQDTEAGEKTLEDTAREALRQIKKKKYAAELTARGIRNVLQYGFAFSGKRVLIRQESP